MNKTTINPITGLIHVTGEPDTGKTTFALSCGFKPSEIVFLDDDLKTQSIADQLEAQKTPFGRYVNLTKKSLGMREIEYHDLVMKEVSALETGKYRVLIFDTWTRFENTFHPVVQKDPMKFKQFYSPKGDIKGAEMWKAAFDYEAIVIDKLLQVAPLVILITHLKDHTIGAVKTGAEIPDCKKPVVEKSRIRLWLRHNPDGPAPIGLVLKRLSKVEVGMGGIVPVNVLPRKINPCTWERILGYWDQPIGANIPSKDEVPNAFEYSILDGVLTPDQKDALHINSVMADEKVNDENASKKAALTASKTTRPNPSVFFTLDDMIAAFGEEEVKNANGGEMPVSQADIDKVASVLFE